jgi:hypothetical protein
MHPRMTLEILRPEPPNLYTVSEKSLRGVGGLNVPYVFHFENRIIADDFSWGERKSY